MSSVEDPRKTRTKKLLLDAFVTLLEEHELDEVSVNDLTEKAGISRTTFYRNFLDKSDFLEKMMNDLLDGIFERCQYWPHSIKKSNNESYYHEFFKYMAENSLFFKTFLKSEKWPQFNQKLIDNGIAAYTKIIEEANQTMNSDLPISFLVNYIVSAHVGVITYWLKDGCRYSADYMSKNLSYITVEGVLRLMGLDDSKIMLPK